MRRHEGADSSSAARTKLRTKLSKLDRKITLLTQALRMVWVGSERTRKRERINALDQERKAVRQQLKERQN